VKRAGALLRWSLAVGLATVLLVICFRGVEWEDTLRAAAGAHGGWLTVALLANASVVALWALQWRLFLRRRSAISYRRMLRITAVMAMTANSLPYMAGQATGVHLLATRGRLGHAAALSVLTLDQLSEGLAKVVLLGALALLAPLPEPLRAALLVLTPAVALFLGLTLVSALRPALLDRAAGRLLRGPLVALLRFARQWSEGLARARQPGVLAAGAGLSLAMRAVEAAGMIAVQTALGIDLPIQATLAVLAAVSLATMVSVAPGNLGVYEASALLAYRWAGVEPEAALALALLQHLAYLAAMGGAGWAAITLRTARGTRPAARGAAAASSEPLRRPAAPDRP
jgi:hypothetical protein